MQNKYMHRNVMDSLVFFPYKNEFYVWNNILYDYIYNEKREHYES